MICRRFEFLMTINMKRALLWKSGLLVYQKYTYITGKRAGSIVMA